MAEFNIHRTWPCRAQESISAKGWFIAPKVTEAPMPPCPIHGVECGYARSR